MEKTNTSSTKIINVPIQYKPLLTIEEASEYFNIGDKRLRELIKEEENKARKSSIDELVLYVGRKALIKKEAFTEYLLEISSL